jgi:3-deoxy-manno-octulosonate cytidylyltransferase (CMP-KDO synthetase)
MKIIAVIPARFNSKRFRGKPLVKLVGKTMIERVYSQVLNTKFFDNIIVATDDVRIAKEVKRFGGSVVVTSVNHKSGTDRIWEVVKDMSVDGIVNIQGDEPLIPEKLIEEIYNSLLKDDSDVVTAAFKNDSIKDFRSSNIVKVIVDNTGNALYFSRAMIPNNEYSKFDNFLHHIGIYGYKKAVLKDFIESKNSLLEEKENLEQLRFLENGVKIKVLKTNYKSMGVDVPGDIGIVEKLIKEKNE